MMGDPWCGLIFILSFLVSQSKSDVFTALVHLQPVIEAEADFVGLLKKYLVAEQSRINKLTRIVENYGKLNEDAAADAEFLSNPVNAYSLVKRLTVDMQHDVIPVLNTSNQGFMDDMLKLKDSRFPTLDDFMGSATALLRLQEIYQLDPADVALGLMRPHIDKPAPHMSVSDLFELGRVAYSTGEFERSISWMEVALSKSVQHQLLRDENQQHSLPLIHQPRQQGDLELQESLLASPSSTISSSTETETSPTQEILDYLAFSHFSQGNLSRALDLTNMWIEYDPENNRALENRDYYLEVLANLNQTTSKSDNEDTTTTSDLDESARNPLLVTTVTKRRSMTDSDIEVLANELRLDSRAPGDDLTDHELFLAREKLYHPYRQLCRGLHIKNISSAHELACITIDNGHPLLILRPIKLEIVHFSPFVAIFHDIIPDSTIEQIKSFAEPYLTRSTVMKHNNSELLSPFVYDHRICKSAWLSDYLSPVINTVSKFSEAITKITLYSAEELQVVNYGIGGHYEPHYDFARDSEKGVFDEWRGNRLATLMFYLTNVEAGGATVFPELGLKVYPRKGTALFWFNLYKDGSGDYATYHAACPVLSGTKWVANKWFHSVGNEVNFSCGLGRDDRYSIADYHINL